MQMIKRLSEYIESEIEDAEGYIKCAIKLKDNDVLMAKTFYDLSVDEMRHMTMLHEQVVKLITDYKSKGNSVPEGMQALYDYLHEKHIEEANEVKTYQAQYREQ